MICGFWAQKFPYLTDVSKKCGQTTVQKVPALCAIWNLEETVSHEIFVIWTVGSPSLTLKAPTCTYISQKLWYWKLCKWGIPCSEPVLWFLDRH